KVSAWENDQSLLEFRLLSQRITDRVRERLDDQQQYLEQLERFFAAQNTPITRENFRTLTRDLHRRFPPAVQAVEWALPVPKPERAAFEEQQRMELPGFEIRERDAAGALVPAGDRDVFYPTTYVEPLEGNRKAVGFDLASSAARQEAILTARESGA